MAKVRVYQLAQELGMQSKDFINQAQALGYSYIKSHANTLEESEAAEIKKKISAGQGQQKPKKRTVLRRRTIRASSEQVSDEGEYQVVVTRLSGDSREVIERKRIELPTLPKIELPQLGGTTPAEDTQGPAHTTTESAPAPALESPATAQTTQTPVSTSQAAPVVAAETAAPTQLESPAQATTVEVPAQETPSESTTSVSPPPTTPTPEQKPLAQEPSTQSNTTPSDIAEPVKTLETPPVETPKPRPAPKKQKTKQFAEIIGRIEPKFESKKPPAPKWNETISTPPSKTETPLHSTQEITPGSVPEKKKRAPRGRFVQKINNQQPRRQSNKPHKKKRKEKKNGNKTPTAPSTEPMSEKKKVIKVDEAISVAELAHRMGVKAPELMRKLLSQGVMVTINQTISVELATNLAKEFGYEVQDITFEEEALLQDEPQMEDPALLKHRPPVVTVMGHVDHGKTSLLDAIRETNQAAQEAGGITQHIGASVVESEQGKIVFLDTPGHEAFTAMRARGAQSTDIVVLVVAADDGIMPQTREAISHAQAAEVPIVVAVNKIDKAGSNPDRVRNDLMQFGLVPEEYGGDTLIANVSAHTGEGIPGLLESISLQAELMELQANPDKRAHGLVIESRLEKGRGPVATVLVQEGTLESGDVVVAGPYYGKVRALFNHKNKKVKKASPSIPVRLLGLSGLPAPGEQFDSVADEKAAKQIAEHRQEQLRRQELATPSKRASLFDLFDQQDKKELKIILKADVQGTLEALKENLLKLKSDEIETSIPYAAVGGISENDVNLATTTEAIIIGFNIRADNQAQRLAESEGIEIRTYRVIYDLINDVKAAMQKQLAPTVQEKPIGQAEIRKVFNIPKIGRVAGCYVTDGKITRNSLMRLYRNDVQIYEGKVATLKRFKNDVREVKSGFECGMQIEGYQDLKENDIIEAYELEEIETKLELE